MSYRGPGWLKNVVAREHLCWFDRVVEVNLCRDKDAESHLRRLLELPYLEELHLADVDVSAEIIEAFRQKFPKLRIERITDSNSALTAAPSRI